MLNALKCTALYLYLYLWFRLKWQLLAAGYLYLVVLLSLYMAIHLNVTFYEQIKKERKRWKMQQNALKFTAYMHRLMFCRDTQICIEQGPTFIDPALYILILFFCCFIEPLSSCLLGPIASVNLSVRVCVCVRTGVRVRAYPSVRLSVCLSITRD